MEACEMCGANCRPHCQPPCTRFTVQELHKEISKSALSAMWFKATGSMRKCAKHLLIKFSEKPSCSVAGRTECPGHAHRQHLVLTSGLKDFRQALLKLRHFKTITKSSTQVGSLGLGFAQCLVREQARTVPAVLCKAARREPNKILSVTGDWQEKP